MKVRKIHLLQALDLPLDETYVFTGELVRSNPSRLFSVAECLFLNYIGVLIRTAWLPDLLSAPWFRTSNMDEFKQALHELTSSSFSQSHSSHRFTHLILHGDLSDPYDPNDRHRHIAGRLLFHPYRDIPRDRTLEVVHGEYIAKIFDTKGFDFSDDRFAGYTIDVGQVCWRPFKVSPWITVDDMRIIIDNFKSIDEKLRRLMQVLALVARRTIADLALCIEFGASKGSGRVFYTHDFDYAFTK